jgi:Peptidase family M28
MRRTFAVLLPLALVLALAVWRGKGPEPRDRNTPASEFSAMRATDTLRALLAEGVPHAIGTAANARVRDRVVARLRELGYETTVQRRFACNAAAVCGMVENVFAYTTKGPDTVLVMAHYDSVGAGVGASDDGVGTAAVLEIARALRGQRFRNPIAFLITDGEEAGLLGAEAFIADESLSRDVSAVVNVEMRGTYGASNMFETSTGNRWLIRHLAGALERPQATSFFYAIYNLLPNDTDVTIFKRAGKAAVNFAAIRGVNWYHTPYDDLAHVNAGTMQHHGDNMLATVRALAGADLAARSNTDATYFDILGFHMIWWPQEWTLWIAVLSLVLLLVAARRQPPREMTFGVLTAFTALLLAVLGGIALTWLASLRSEGIPFVAHPGTSIAAMMLSGIAAALLAAALFARRAQPLPMLYGVAIVWHAIGIALAIALPGAAFVFIVPAVVVTVCALARANEIATSAIAATAGAIILLPMALMLYDALGSSLMTAVALLMAALFTLVAPLFPRPRNGVVAAVLALACALTAMLQPAYDAEQPRKMTLSHIDDRSPRWTTGRLTPQLSAAAKFTPYEDDVRGKGYAAPAPRVAPRVALSATRNGQTLTVRVRSSRGANRLTLLLKGDAKVLRVNGTPIPPRPARFRERLQKGWHLAIANAVDEMVVECTARGPIEAIAGDMTFGLPAAAAPLVAARNASTAIPIQDGDTTVTRARARF